MSLWICPHCNTLTGPEHGPCPKCGTPTTYATIHRRPPVSDDTILTPEQVQQVIEGAALDWGLGLSSPVHRLIASHEALRQQLAATAQWQPIATAPKDGAAFLAATKFLGMPCVERIWWDKNRWEGAQGEQRFDAWQPLPAPPQEPT